MLAQIGSEVFRKLTRRYNRIPSRLLTAYQILRKLLSDFREDEEVFNEICDGGFFPFSDEDFMSPLCRIIFAVLNHKINDRHLKCDYCYDGIVILKYNKRFKTKLVLAEVSENLAQLLTTETYGDNSVFAAIFQIISVANEDELHRLNLLRQCFELSCLRIIF